MNWAVVTESTFVVKKLRKTFFFHKSIRTQKQKLTAIENVWLYDKEKPPKRHDFSLSHLRESPGELHVLGGRVAALQEPRLAVHFHQTLVVIVVDGWAQHPQLQLLGAGVVDVLQGDRNNRLKDGEPIRLRSYARSATKRIPLNSLAPKSS